MSELVTTADEGSYTLLTMDDGKANALSFDMLAALKAALDEVEQAGKVVVLAGRPGKFSAGFDLSVMSRGDDSTVQLLRAGADLSSRLMEFPTPVILAVTGHALAMGALLCLSADYRVGIRGDFKVGLNEAAIGMTLPWFGVELARARLATHHFNAAVAMARIYDPDGAAEAGYLDEVVEDSALMARAAAVAEAAATLDATAHRGSKQRVREEYFARRDEALRKDFAE